MNGFGGFGRSRSLLEQFFGEDPFAAFDNDPFFSHGITPFQYRPRRVPPSLQASLAAQHPEYYITDEHGRREGTYGNGASVRDIPIFGGDLHVPSAAPRGNITIAEMDPEEEHPSVSQHRARSQHAIVEHPDEDDYNDPGPEARHNGASSSRHQPKQESERLGSHSAAMHHARADYAPSQTTTTSQRARNEPAAGSYQFFSYSSSSSSSVFGNGPARSYSTTTTTHVGPDQMPRTETTVHDQTGSAETVTVSRNIGHRGRTVTRTRDSTGREQQQDQLHNISDAERQRFEEEWQRQAGFGIAPHPGARTSAPSRALSGSRRLQP